MNEYENSGMGNQSLTPGYMIARIVFAIVSYMFAAGTAPAWLIYSWGALWAGNLLKDLVTGIGPMQSAGGAALRGVGWLLWVAMILSAII